jgi:hypothetical protein
VVDPCIRGKGPHCHYDSAEQCYAELGSHTTVHSGRHRNHQHRRSLVNDRRKHHEFWAIHSSIVTATTTAYVTATSVADRTKKATARVTVNPTPSVLKRIALSPKSASLYVGSTQQFSAVAYDQLA